ncbi:SPOR domain-containing protein [Salinisphaera sp. RV14]|uniref:SPOR domain-containing protein n=1 Tax=Salinisphaera sp. RV14 TaxID=3454140 RepID=UPI003F85EE46
MNDVMKKRLIGVAILVIIGVLAPLLLSRCMHGGSQDNGRGSMRVYDVQPDGKAEPAGHDNDDQAGASPATAPSAAGGDESGASQGRPQAPTPDAVSPQSKQGFSVPPVHGGSGSASKPSGSHAPSSKPASGVASANNGAGGNPHSGSHDHGASAAGSGAASASSSSSSGLEKSSIQGWVVQVASFSQQGNAADLANQLKGRFPVSYAPGQVNGKTWYRVNVGPFDSKQAAQSAADRLSKAGHKGLVRQLP